MIKDLLIRYKLKLPAGIEIKVEIQEDLPKIEADKAQLTTVLTNLLDNSIHAIDPPGEIVIKVHYAERVQVDRNDLVAADIEIEITDTGRGMDEETQRKIYRPFYTTKEDGSGLGLSIVQKIIQAHNGSMELFSKIGLGTRVTIRLPLRRTQTGINSEIK